MKPHGPEDTPRIRRLLRGVGGVAGAGQAGTVAGEGYHKLKAAIRTLGYVTELLEKKNDAGGAARVVGPCQHRTEGGRSRQA